MTLADGKIPVDVMETAAAWLLRFEEPRAEAPEALKAEFAAWLAADETHRHAWELAQRAWSVAGEAAISPAISTNAGKAGQRTGMIKMRYAIPAIAAALLLFIFTPTLSVWLRSDVQTATAETRNLSLEDGSQIVVGADSAVTHDFSGDRRRVVLLRGAAWFKIARDAARPFIVTAGDMTVTVTGTDFGVTMTEHTLSVALARGSVEVDRPGPPKQTLHPGHHLSLDRETGSPRITKADPALMGRWRSGQLIVHCALLSDVVETIDRYYPGTITLIGRSVAEKRVTGVFNLTTPEKALRSLVSPYGVSVRNLTPWTAVIRGQ